MIVVSTTAALILAGGKATRLGGIDRREIVVEGRTIFERQCEVLAPRVAEIIVSSPRPIAGFRTVVDAVPDAGPLAGIAAGLAAATTPWLLVVAGDMPHLTGALIDLVLGKIAPHIDAVGVRIGELPEPLLCALRTSCAPEVTRRIDAGQLKVSRLLTDSPFRVAWVEEPELRTIDPALRCLRNINAPEDLGSP